MKKWWLILMFLVTKHSTAQDTCLPRYNLPLQTISLKQGYDLSYVQKGKGIPIIFVHGLGGNLSHWTKSVEELSSRFCCIAIDLPGYGHSFKAINTGDKLQLQFYADAIIDFIKEKKLKKVVLAGHSMGAQVAIIAALQEPFLVSKLVLAAPAGLETFTATEASLLINATQPVAFEKQDEKAIRLAFKQNFHSQPSDVEPLIQDRLRLKSCAGFRQYTETVSRGVKGMLAQPVRNELPGLQQPVLIIFGANDALIPNKLLHASLSRETLLKEATEAIKKASVVIIPEAGHLLQFEKPAEVNRAIKDFLK